MDNKIDAIKDKNVNKSDLIRMRIAIGFIITGFFTIAIAVAALFGGIITIAYLGVGILFAGIMMAKG